MFSKACSLGLDTSVILSLHANNSPQHATYYHFELPGLGNSESHRETKHKHQMFQGDCTVTNLSCSRSMFAPNSPIA